MRLRIGVFLCSLCLLAASCAGPVPASDGEAEASGGPSRDAAQTTAPASSLPVVEDLLPVEEYSDPRQEAITHIVVHFMSAVRDHPENPYDWPANRQIFLDAGVSSHYVIERDGTIRRLIPEERVAWHAGKGSWLGDERYTDRMNQYSVGIELLGIGTGEEMAAYMTPEEYAQLPQELLGFTDEQYASLQALIGDIRRRHPGIAYDREHILGHDEYASRKSDPGALFDWSRLGL